MNMRKEAHMANYRPAPELVTPEWLTAVLCDSGVLASGIVITVDSRPTNAFNSHTSHLQLTYSADSPAGLATRMVLKRNIPEPWAIEAGAAEVAFYRLVAGLPARPPAIVPCYAAEHDSVSGDSYLLLHDLSESHTPPITRDQQVGIVQGVPPDGASERVVDALAQHHGYWWNHPALDGGVFEVGYWSRDAERFGLYLERRSRSWQSLLEGEASWFPTELRALYEHAFAHLRAHWARALEPRFRARANRTLVHGDAYFANFLCPKVAEGPTYLLDWQSPTVDIAGYDLANLLAAFWTPEQRHEGQREQTLLRRYHAVLRAQGVRDYAWGDLVADYRAGLIYWLLVPLQDRYGGAPKEYWWPKLQCLAAAFREWGCAALLDSA